MRRWYEFLLCGTLLLMLPSRATVVGLGIIEQPINLVAQSDPSCIPLGPVVIESNHGYGIHEVIVAARPCLHGGRPWTGGVELNQNLASVFGISLDIPDDTNICGAPMKIVLKKQARPSYSPYTRQQVVAATIHCLLRSVYATPKTPIKVSIFSENPEDQQWIDRLPKEFITHAEKADEKIVVTKVPGTQIEVDAYGVANVVFADVKPSVRAAATAPVLLPVSLAGGDSDAEGTILLPVWTGDAIAQPWDAIGRPYHLFYDCFQMDAPLISEVNLLQRDRFALRWSVQETATQTELVCYFSTHSQETVCAALQAAIFSIRPTTEHPLLIRMFALGENTLWQAPFESSGDWTRVQKESQQWWECLFVLRTDGSLAKGKVPNSRVEKSAKGLYVATFIADPPAAVESPKIPLEATKKAAE